MEPGKSSPKNDPLPAEFKRLRHAISSLRSSLGLPFEATAEIESALRALSLRVHQEEAAMNDANSVLRRKMEECLQTAKALKESEARYRALVEQIPAVTYIFAQDEVMTPLYVSPQMGRLLGISQDEIRRNPAVMRQLLHPEDSERVIGILTEYRNRREPLVLEYRMQSRDGYTAWFRDESVLVREASGNRRYRQGVMFNITERKESEKILEASEKSFRYLASHLLAAMEDERRSMATALHDRIGQQLAATKLETEMVLRKLRSSGAGPDLQLENIVTRIQGIIESFRKIHWDLRPPSLDELGLLAAVKWLFREFGRMGTPLTAEYRFQVDETEIPEALKIVIYRIIQETLVEILPAGGAGRAVFSLVRRGDALELGIIHDGNFPGNEDRQEEDPDLLRIDRIRRRTEFSKGAFTIESDGAQIRIRAAWPVLPQA